MEEISTTPQERAQLKFEFYIVLFFFFWMSFTSHYFPFFFMLTASNHKADYTPPLMGA